MLTIKFSPLPRDLGDVIGIGKANYIQYRIYVKNVNRSVVDTTTEDLTLQHKMAPKWQHKIYHAMRQ